MTSTRCGRGRMMRVTTLKAAGDRLGGLLAYDAGLVEDRQRSGPQRGPVEYYLDPGEPAGRWWGRGRALGLDCGVTGEDLRAVLEEHHPEPGGRLSAVRGLVGSWVRCDVLGAEVGVGAVGAHSGSVGAGRGPRLARRRRRCRPRLPRTPRRRHPARNRRRRPGRHARADRRGVPPAHVADHGPSAAHPRRDRRQGAGPDRAVALARCPVPQAAAAHDRVGLRRRPS